MNKVLIFGHRKPDTDSVCGAISLSYLKNAIGVASEPRVLSEINKEMVASLKKLEPFGEGNKTPIFAFKNLKIDSIRALSEGKHIKMTLKDGNTIVNAIGFNLGSLASEYKIDDKIDVVGNLEINSFNGVDNIQINIKDLMKSL